MCPRYPSDRPWEGLRGPDLTASLRLTFITFAGQRLCDAVGGRGRKIHWPRRISQRGSPEMARPQDLNARQKDAYDKAVKEANKAAEDSGEYSAAYREAVHRVEDALRAPEMGR